MSNTERSPEKYCESWSPVRARMAEQALVGERATEAVFSAVATQAAAELSPSSDIHANSEFKRHLARVLTERAHHRASARAIA